MEDIEHVEKITELPSWSKSSGTAMDTLEKGTFFIRNVGKCEVFLNPENTEFLHFSADGTDYYMSGSDDAQTDHDTVDGVAEAMQAAENTSLTVIPGAEFSSPYEGKEIHILGLYLNPHCPELLSALQQVREIRNRRNEELLALFQADGFPIKYEDLIHGNEHTVITRAHFARALLEKGCVTSVSQAFDKYLGDGKKYYRPKQMIEPEEAIRLIRVAGGLPALAHPLQYKLGWKKTEQLLSYLKEAGMMGIEVYYSSHSQSDSLHLREIASRLGLVSTGGSDFHGANKPDIHLGSGYGGLRVSALLLDNIKARLQQKNS